MRVDPMLPRRFRITEKKQETPDTYTFAMTPVEGDATLRFSPGQFNMLYLFGLGEVPISISGDPDKPEVLVHTARAMGSVTRAFAALGPGEMVGIRGPFGSTCAPVRRQSTCGTRNSRSPAMFSASSDAAAAS